GQCEEHQAAKHAERHAAALRTIVDRRRRDQALQSRLSTLRLSPLVATAFADKCVAAAEHGQELQRAGRFRAALTQFGECSKAECPADVAADCREWATKAE